MPEATLLRPAESSYSFRFGVKMYTFLGGVPKEVPPAVGIALSKKIRDDDGKPLFKVSGLPELLSGSEAGVKASEQNVNARQLEIL